MQQIHRTHCWTVTYIGTGAHLELVLDKGRAKWRVFAHAPKHLACNSKLRAKLEQPVARGSVVTSFFGDEWQLKAPGQIGIPISIEGSGGSLASWWAKNGMPDFVNHKVPEFLEIHVDHEMGRLLNGRY